ncbi:SRPBCC family protein [Siccirubricoccus phaeus]|uniref:SRPBCC family protein n=1 Tax=Siccirubricoccus phaeus TaxID=2595053 RepID=UPI00165CBEC9|nr:SRPBCC family protein [Siccirubricoccus phaeus]
MEISEQTRIPAPLAEVWPLLRDPSLVASCIPGASLAPDQGDGQGDNTWRGSIRVKFGPTAAVFRGEATLAFDDAAHRCAIEGRGIDQRGASRALSSGSIEAKADGASTLLLVAGSFTVTGPLETFANAGGVHLARALLADFSANMAKLVAERQTAAPAAEPASAADAPGAGGAAPNAAFGAAPGAAPAAAASPPPPPPRPSAAPVRELSATRLLWQALLSWLRSLFGTTRKP